MAGDMMNLRALAEKTPDDLLREMSGFAAERLMQKAVAAGTGAPYGEKNALLLARRTAIMTEIGRRGPARWGSASRSSTAQVLRTAPIGREGADRRYPGKFLCRTSRHDRLTTWSRLWRRAAEMHAMFRNHETGFTTLTNVRDHHGRD